MSKTIEYKSSFTLLKENNNYEDRVTEVLTKFKHEDLNNATARKWIARCVCEVYELDASNITDKEVEDKRLRL